MAKKVGINGAGTIGRLIAKIILKYFPELEIAAFNDPNMTAEELAYLMRHDTNHAYLSPDWVETENGKIILNGKTVHHFQS